MRISYSSLKTYQICPLQYKYKYIDKLPEKRRPELIFGKFIHQILFEILNHKIPLPQNSDGLTRAQKLLKEKWPQEDLGEPKNNFFLKGNLLLEQFFKSFNPEAQEILSAEEKFAVPLGEHLLSGIIDRIDKLPNDVLEIIDYKTGRPSSQESIHQNQQLTFYYQATKARFPEFKEIRLTLHFLEKDIKFSSQRGKADVLQLQSTIDEVSGKIIQKQFPPQLGSLCRFCDYNEICPHFAKVFDPEAQTRRASWGKPAFAKTATVDKGEKELDFENLIQMSLLE